MVRRFWPLANINRLQVRLAFVIALAVTTLIGADAINLLSARVRTIDAAQSETANLSRSLADQAHGVFQTMDTILVGLRERVETDGTNQAALERLHRLLEIRSAALPIIHRLLVTDETGRILVSSGVQAATLHTIERGPSFHHHVGNLSRAAFVGWPVQDIVDGTWVVTVSRRIDHADGSFAGVVTASISTEFFRRIYAGFNTGYRGVILLVRNDGVNIARWPADPRGEAYDSSRSDLFTRVVGPGDRERFQNYSQADRLMRLASYHRVPDAPALVMVGRSRQDVLSGWRQMVGAHLLGLWIVLGTLALLSHRLGIKMGEAERTQTVLRDANQRLARSEASTAVAKGWLEMAEQVSQVGHWNLALAQAGNTGTDGAVVSWSDEVYRIHGLDRLRTTLTLESALSAYHRQDRPVVSAALQAALHQSRPFEFSARLIRPDNSTRHVLGRGLPQTAADGTITGVFGVLMDITEQKRSEAALRDAHEAAETANHALEAANRALEALAMQDALTGLANRRHFDRALDNEFRRTARAGDSLALVLIDVDHFKQFNDIYGHQAGDACLRAIAAIIPPLLNRLGDTAARYGGEEIAVLLPGNTEAGALVLAHSIADGVRGLSIPHAGSAHGVVTISAGVQAFVPVYETMTASTLVEHADLALYAAKRAGRDRVVAHQDLELESAVI